MSRMPKIYKICCFAAAMLLCLIFAWSALAESSGVINHDQVRFRRKMDSTDVWAMLDTGWPVQIISSQKYQGTSYYYVCASTPKNPDRHYWGYIDQRYVSAAAAVPAVTEAPAAAMPAAETPYTVIPAAVPAAEAVPAQAAAPAAAPAEQQAAPAQAGSSQAIRFIVDEVNLRSAATTGSVSLGRFHKGQTVTFDAAVESNGRTWYHVQAEGKSGYVLGTCVEVVSNTGSAQSASAPAPAAEDTAGARAANPCARAARPPPAGPPPPAVTDIAAAAATPAPAAAPAKTGYIKTIKNKVWVRKAPSTQAHTRVLAEIGSVFACTDTVTENGVQWHVIQYGGETCYIMAKYCGFVTEEEYKEGQTATAASQEAAATPAPVQVSAGGIALTVMEKVIVRSAGSARAEEVKLLNSSGQVCTLTGQTNTADGHSWYQVNVKNITGWIRSDLLRVLSDEEAKAYTNTAAASSGGSKLYSPELSDWYTGDIQKVFYRGCVGTVTDLKTGISFKVRRWAGGSHADVEPLTAADTAAMCRVYGVGSAQQISDNNLYQRRSILLTVGSRSFAASMYGIPHNYPEGDTISDNDFRGQFCIHFVNSALQGGSSGSNKTVDADHQAAVQYAYQNAVTKLTGYGYSFE